MSRLPGYTSYGYDRSKLRRERVLDAAVRYVVRTHEIWKLLRYAYPPDFMVYKIRTEFRRLMEAE